MLYTWGRKVSFIERCPHFRGVLIERGFHCTDAMQHTLISYAGIVDDFLCVECVVSLTDIVDSLQIMSSGFRYHQ